MPNGTYTGRPGFIGPVLNRAGAGAVLEGVGRTGRVTDDAEKARLRALCAEHGSALFGYALRLSSGDRGRAEDVVQEVLIRAWRHPEAVEPSRGPIRPWLFTVARRVAVDAHRQRRARPQEVGDGVLAVVPAAEEIDASLDRILVTDALAALSEEHRAVLVHTYYRGQSVAEAAAALGIPQGTVKSRSYYALRALKLALAERGITT